MSIFKCKICGGSLEIDSAQSVATCEYCGTRQTLPKLDDERRANLYDRANHFRRNNDFDKAMGIYENILNEDNTDAEAYWSIVLCRYGIEYVEDPATHKRVPTVNRAQFTSIFDDEDYKSAIVNADGYQREIYEAEATAINEIQKGILAISQKEEPFDVFVCYKETDTSGRRTQDSVLATELYHELTREGFKVFFSRITLEDKLGVAYEPYIFAALHSAKVMVVIGTRPEHFNAVWVKNEWSRFLALIKNGAKKTLIPAYRDMDPYDLPEEFSHLQAQDMSKLGFMQDLTRGIKKIVEAEAPKASVKETIVATATTLNVAPLLKRAFMFLEDGDFDRADEFCEQVLNQDPENAQAYLGKLMAELRVKRQADLANCAESFDNNKNYEKAVRFADTTLSSELRGYVATIKDRNARKAEEARKEALYLKAMDDYKTYDIQRLQEAIKAFTSLSGYKDSDERIRLCQSKIDQIRIKEENDRIESERLAEEKRIADEKARLEKQRQDEINRIEAQKRARRNKKIAMIASPIVVAFVVFIIILNSVIIPNGKYNDAVDLMNSGKYEDAYKIFQELGDYKDSADKLKEIATVSPSTIFKLCQVGDTIIFGQYEQDGNTANGKEDIKWRVLKIENNKILMISEECLESKRIHPDDVNVTWETSSIRQWLNSDFLNTFNEKQQSFIQTSYLSNDTYVLNSNSGNNTYDKVFLLSVNEARTLFNSNEDRQCSFSKQASNNNDSGCWWLRTKGEGYLASTYVKANGEINTKGVNYWGTSYGIRPAIWIDISGQANSEVNASGSSENTLENKYSEAIALGDKGKYQEAINILTSIGDYKDSNSLIKKYELLGCKVGNVVKVGTYEQDNNSSNGKEDVEWIVLERSGDKVLLISKYCLDYKELDRNDSEVPWSDSQLRTWLNGTFINNAFSSSDKNIILSSTLANDDANEVGESTNDKVFVLSMTEASKYFSSDSGRKTQATSYAISNGAKEGNTYWQLRTISSFTSPTTYTSYYATVSVGENGKFVYIRYAAIRPAMWVDVSNLK